MNLRISEHRQISPPRRTCSQRDCYSHRHSSRRRRRGVIFITAIWIIVILAAMALIFARSMRVELAAASNRVSTEQAATIELGAEQYVMSAVDACYGDAVTVLQTPAEQISLGEGYFWIIQTYYTDDKQYAFGITDENSKLNINVATDDSLALLPGMRQDVADSIIKWVGSTTNTKTQGQGADNSVYSAMPRPYSLKGAPFESVEELYLIPNVTDTLMYGYDLDHNGMLDLNEMGNGLATDFNAANDIGRGIVPFITVWGTEPNTDVNGKPRINLSAMGQNTTALRAALKALPAARVTQIAGRAAAVRTFRNIFDFALKTGMTSQELGQVQDRLTTSPLKVLPGLVNVNDAPQQVLACLPGLTSDDVAKIVAQRPGNVSGSGGLGGAAASAIGGTPGGGGTAPPTSDAWIMDVITKPKAAAIGNLITGRSFFYSADIVAVSGDGRSFKRVRIVLDARNSPPVMVYRKDLTQFGWPLSPDILKAMKTHQPLPAMSGMGTGGANGLSILGQ